MKKFLFFMSVVALLAVGCNQTTLNGTQSSKQSNKIIHPAYEPSRINYAYVDNGTRHVIYNGQDLGVGIGPILDGNDIAFTDNNSHLIYNGKDLGEYTYSSKAGGGSFWPPILNSGHVAFFRTVKNKLHLIYDGKDQGNVTNPILDGDNLVFSDSNNNVIYNGKNLGEGGSFVLVNNHLAYIKFPNAYHIIYDGKDLGLGNNPMLAGNSFGYVSQANGVDHIIFNGKDLGEGGYPCAMNENHIACVREIGTPAYEYHIIYDGKDLGIGNYPKLDGDNIVYSSSSDDYSLKYNGDDIGQGGRAIINNANYAYEKSNGVDYSDTNVIYNGTDLGPGTFIQLLDNNIAYSLAVEGKGQTMFNGKLIDGTDFVMSEKK